MCMTPKHLRISTSNYHMQINWFMVSELAFQLFTAIAYRARTHTNTLSPCFLCHGPYFLWMYYAARLPSHFEAAQSETWVWHVWCAIVWKAHHIPSEVTPLQVLTMMEDVLRLPLAWSRRYRLATPLPMVASQPLKWPLSLLRQVMAWQAPHGSLEVVLWGGI